MNAALGAEDASFQDFVARELSELQVRVLAAHERSVAAAGGGGATSACASASCGDAAPTAKIAATAAHCRSASSPHLLGDSGGSEPCRSASSPPHIGASRRSERCHSASSAHLGAGCGADAVPAAATPNSATSPELSEHEQTRGSQDSVSSSGDGTTPPKSPSSRLCSVLPNTEGLRSLPRRRPNRIKTCPSDDSCALGFAVEEHAELRTDMRHTMSLSSSKSRELATPRRKSFMAVTCPLLSSLLKPHGIWVIEDDEEVMGKVERFKIGAAVQEPAPSVRRWSMERPSLMYSAERPKLSLLARGGSFEHARPKTLPSGLPSISALDPSSKPRIVWDIMGVLLLVYDIIVIPLQVFGVQDSAAAEAMFWLSLCYWSMDIPASFFVGFTVDGSLELNLRAIALRYLRSGFLFFDLFLVSVDVLGLVGKMGGETTGTGEQPTGIFRTLRMTRVLRTLRVLRLIKLPYTIMALQENIHSEYISVAVGMAKLTAAILAVNHYIACFWYLFGKVAADEDPGGDSSWLQRNHLVGEPTAYLYTTSLHWSLTQFTPASMEVYPCSLAERTYAIFVILFALVTFSSFVSSITNAMTHLRNINSEQTKQFAMLKRYFRTHSISLRLCVRVRRHLDHLLSQRQRTVSEESVPLLCLLSDPLKVELHYEVFAPVLCAHTLFERFDVEVNWTMRQVCHVAVRQLTLSRGDVLFSHGDASKRMYFGGSGAVGYVRHAQGLDGAAQILEDHRWWLSEAALWTPWVHHGQARAHTHCGLYALEVEPFHHAVMKNRVAMAAPSHYAHMFVDHLNNVDPMEMTDLHMATYDTLAAVEIAWSCWDEQLAGEARGSYSDPKEDSGEATTSTDFQMIFTPAAEEPSPRPERS